jgi:hemerythrin superfamily protein
LTATKTVDPIELLKDDHEKVKKLFDQFEQGKSESARVNAARKAIMELEVHAEIEEKIFYPAFREQSKADDADGVFREATEEHHVQHLLIGELKKMQDDDPEFEAKFTVLAENVRHHIQEEESEMLPEAKELDGDLLAELGSEMMGRKKELMAEAKGQ